MKAAFNKILNRKKKTKGNKTGPGLNQSMINIIVNEAGNNESFMSHQPEIVRSPSIGGTEFEDFSDRLDLMIDSPDKIVMRTNISSVFNVPKKRSIIEDLYEILHEHVIDQLGEIISSKKSQRIKIELPKVHSNDFKEYIETLKPVYSLYKKQNMRRLKRTREMQHIDIKGSLTNCYAAIPKEYFMENFFFQFDYLTNDQSKLTQVQETLASHLDKIESNLYIQLTTKFQEFVSLILKLSQMEAQIQNSLYSARFFRNLNKELLGKCANGVKEVLKLRKRKENLESVSRLFNALQSAKQIVPNLKQLVENNNLQKAISLLKSSEEVIFNELSGIKIFKNLKRDFHQSRDALEHFVTTRIENCCLNYLKPAFCYTKKTQQIQNLSDMSLVEESFINVSTIDNSMLYDDEPTSSLSLNWTLEAFQRSTQIEEYISHMILDYIEFQSYPMKTYREKLSGLLNAFHDKFIQDMDEYYGTLVSNKSVQNVESSFFDLHVKFVLFYFHLIKRFVQNQYLLIHQILIRLMGFANKRFIGLKDDIQDEKATAFGNFRGTVDELYETIDLLFWHFNNKMGEIIKKKTVEKISIHQYSKLNALFVEIHLFLQEDLKVKMLLDSWISTDNERVKTSLQTLHGEYCRRIDLNSLSHLKIQCGKDFLSFYHKSNIDLLKHDLEQDSWQISDIPYTYKIYFDMLLYGDIRQKESEKQDDEDNEDIFQSSRPDINDLEVVRRLALGENISSRKGSNYTEIATEHETFKHEKGLFEIKKNELVLANKKYKICSSGLVLIRLICDYYNIAHKFSYLAEISLSKMFDLLKFYNSFTRRLINGAEAIMFGKVKKITAKILGLSIVSLDLIQNIIQILKETVLQTINSVQESFLQKEVSLVSNEIQTHINEIKSKICQILKTKLFEQSSELKYMNWGDMQGKINIPTKSSASILHNIRQMYKTIEDVLYKEQLVGLFSLIFHDLKITYIGVFENLPIENKLSAKRIKEELEYFKEDLHQISIFQEEELNFQDFENKIQFIVDTKCNPFLAVENVHLAEPQE